MVDLCGKEKERREKHTIGLYLYQTKKDETSVSSSFPFNVMCHRATPPLPLPNLLGIWPQNWWLLTHSHLPGPKLLLFSSFFFFFFLLPYDLQKSQIPHGTHSILNSQQLFNGCATAQLPILCNKQKERRRRKETACYESVTTTAAFLRWRLNLGFANSHLSKP